MLSDADSTVKFQFHALVTIDEHGLPCGEASTDLAAVTPDGRLSQGFDHVSSDGYGIAQLSFEIEVPVSKMWFGHPIIKGQLLEGINDLYSQRALSQPESPATIDAVEYHKADEDVGFGDGLSPEDDEDFDPIDFGEFPDEE